MIQYRQFRNFDPPDLAEVWNECCTGRGTYPLRIIAPLERWVFSKPYFDPGGLIVGLDGNQPIGFIHAGFGPNEEESAIDTKQGVICALAVMPAFRRKGIGTELLRRAELYLTARGSQTIFAGSMKPNNPFYFGLYGGSDSAGFLTSDAAAAPFFEHHGYKGWLTSLVMQRRLDLPVKGNDPRFSTLRRRYEMQVLPRSALGSWWQEAVLGLLEPIEFRLEDRISGLPAARAIVWEMDGYSWRWNHPAAGVLEIQVRPDLRRQGIGKYLLSQLLRYLQEQYFGVCEMQSLERNQPAVMLMKELGFVQVDVGRTFRKDLR